MIQIGINIAVKGESITAVPVYFTTTWTTTAPNETITLPYDAAGTYSGSIDWGDSSTDVNSFANSSHTYALAGTYTVQIIGDCIGWNFGAYSGSTYITSVVHWGQLELGADTGSYFSGCVNLDLSSVSDVLDLTGITTLMFMFDSSSITTINNINLWNTSSITSVSNMFFNATAFNQSLSFDTSAVTIMGGMFAGASSFNQLLLFDTSNVTNMGGMFQNASSFNQSLSTFDTSNVTQMGFMFQNASSFNQSLSTFDTSNVTKMGSMFQNASSFNQSLSTFDTSNVTNMPFMFRNASSFNQSLSTFDTSNVINMGGMFQNASSFNQSLSTFDTSNVTKMGSMFNGADAFDQNIGSWDVANVINFLTFMNSKTPATFSTANLDAIYNGWSASGVQANCNISFGTAKYTVAASAGRAILTGVNTWTITDGGL